MKHIYNFSLYCLTAVCLRTLYYVCIGLQHSLCYKVNTDGEKIINFLSFRLLKKEDPNYVLSLGASLQWHIAPYIIET